MAYYTAQIKNTGDWWIGWCREITGVNCQERTKEKLLQSLRSALLDILEYDQERVLQPNINTNEPFEVVNILPR